MFGLKRLPEILPVFPLTGGVLLPKGHLPLNIFESRYLDMIYHAREKNGLIGMIQPALPLRVGGDVPPPRRRPLYHTGCVGMISDFVEADDDCLVILLTGLSRYDIVEELPQMQTFREVRVSYDRYGEDCAAPFRSDSIDRQKLVLMVEKYLRLYEIVPKWESLEKACDEELVNALAMICPFDSVEKQALLEARTLRKRAELMVQVMDFALSSGQTNTANKIVQ